MLIFLLMGDEPYLLCLLKPNDVLLYFEKMLSLPLPLIVNPSFLATWLVRDAISGQGFPTSFAITMALANCSRLVARAITCLLQ